jgi:hypothetical protein
VTPAITIIETHCLLNSEGKMVGITYYHAPIFLTLNILFIVYILSILKIKNRLLTNNNKHTEG